MQVSVNEALESLSVANGHLFTTVLKHGTMHVEIYRPDKVDLQTPHTRDELYVIISGSGEFLNDGKRSSFDPGDVLFVPAGIEHRFENFTDDFLTWVIFYGPEGEKNKLGHLYVKLFYKFKIKKVVNSFNLYNANKLCLTISTFTKTS